jgi:hypothetical protein
MAKKGILDIFILLLKFIFYFDTSEINTPRPSLRPSLRSDYGFDLYSFLFDDTDILVKILDRQLMGGAEAEAAPPVAAVAPVAVEAAAAVADDNCPEGEEKNAAGDCEQTGESHEKLLEFCKVEITNFKEKITPEPEEEEAEATADPAADSAADPTADPASSSGGGKRRPEVKKGGAEAAPAAAAAAEEEYIASDKCSDFYRKCGFEEPIIIETFNKTPEEEFSDQEICREMQIFKEDAFKEEPKAKPSGKGRRSSSSVGLGLGSESGSGIEQKDKCDSSVDILDDVSKKHIDQGGAFIKDILGKLNDTLSGIMSRIKALIMFIVFASIYPAMPFFAVMAFMLGTVKWLMYKLRIF